MADIKQILLNKLNKIRQEAESVSKSLAPLNDLFSKKGSKMDKLPYMPNVTRTIAIEANFFLVCELLEEIGEDLKTILTENELKSVDFYKDFNSKIDTNKIYQPEELAKLIKETMDGKEEK